MEKFTFRKQPKETGLASVGNPYPDTDIKHNKKVVGHISAPNWQTKDNLWRIRLMVNKSEEEGNCDWKWVTLKATFENEPEAREFLKKHVEAILEKQLHHEED